MSDITAAPMPCKVNGQEMLFSPLRDIDFTELNNWVRYRFIETTEKAIEQMPFFKQEQYRNSVVKVAPTITWNSGEGYNIFSTKEGYIRVGWMMVRQTRKITLEEFDKLVGNSAQDLEEIDRVFIEVNFPQAKISGSSATNGKEVNKEPVKKQQSIAT